MTAKFVVVHRADRNNVGDIASNPLQYFLKEDEYEIVDILNLRRAVFDGELPVIVGGGGLLGNELFTDPVRSVLRAADKNQLLNFYDEHQWSLCNPANKDTHEKFIKDLQELVSETLREIKENNGPRILWGVGHNGEYNRKMKEVTYPEWLPLFDKVSVRDYGQNYHWQPCASCMHPALRKKYTIKNPVIWFEHKKQLVKDFGYESIPRFVNSGSNIEQAIELIGSAEVILTNSYHGAYWGMLMGKRVIVQNPWSSKFVFMKHKPYLLDSGKDWQEIIDDVPVYTDILDEYVSRTETYWEEVKTLA